MKKNSGQKSRATVPLMGRLFQEPVDKLADLTSSESFGGSPIQSGYNCQFLFYLLVLLH
jgi:hypothetical protein